MFGFAIAEHGIQIWIAGQHILVVTTYQRAYPCTWKAYPQLMQQWRCAHQIADVVTADDEDFSSEIRRRHCLNRVLSAHQMHQAQPAKNGVCNRTLPITVGEVHQKECNDDSQRRSQQQPGRAGSCGAHGSQNRTQDSIEPRNPKQHINQQADCADLEQELQSQIVGIGAAITQHLALRTVKRSGTGPRNTPALDEVPVFDDIAELLPAVTIAGQRPFLDDVQRATPYREPQTEPAVGDIGVLSQQAAILFGVHNIQGDHRSQRGNRKQCHAAPPTADQQQHATASQGQCDQRSAGIVESNQHYPRQNQRDQEGAFKTMRSRQKNQQQRDWNRHHRLMRIAAQKRVVADDSTID